MRCPQEIGLEMETGGGGRGGRAWTRFGDDLKGFELRELDDDISEGAL